MKKIIYNNIEFSQLHFDTGSCGRFIMYYNKERNLLYKESFTTKIRLEMMDNSIFQKYKHIIENAEQKEIIGDYLVNGKVVKENCGDYITKYIDGIRFDHLYRIKDVNLLNKIKTQIDILVDKLKLCHNKKLLCGDWGIQNFIYSFEHDRIFNIDTEGFYTYSDKMPHWCNLNLTIKNLYEALYSNTLMNSFSAIVWNNGISNLTSILSMIPDVITYYKFIIKKEDLEEKVNDIYHMDKRCDHARVLPRKIEQLKTKGEEHVFIQFLIKDPSFKKNISETAVNLKRQIRQKYGNIIHVSDNYEESKYLWENYCPSFKFDIFVDNSNKIITREEKDVKDKDNISTISVFKGCIKYSNPLRKYICYKINNQCVFSENEKLTYTPRFSFYTTNHMMRRFKLVK